MTSRDTDALISEVARRYLQLHLTGEIGPVRLRNLIEHFGSIEAVQGASMAELERVDGIGPLSARSVFRSRGSDAVETEITRAAALGVRIICLEDADYPKPLLNTPDPPVCLYLRGSLEPADSVAVAIVGMRRRSHYGCEQAVRFGELLGGAGFTVVSGLARGIDADAHRGALRAGGRTIAVLGQGLSTIYPPEHKSLADEITTSGAVVSELPMDVAPEAGNFPRRNRIIAGLSLGVIVIEAGQRSGALITARLASEYNREVFAVPGRVDFPANSAGVNALIRDGQAKLITGLEDVLDELGPVGDVMSREGRAKPAPKDGSPASGSPADRAATIPTLTGEARAVWDAIVHGAEEADDIRARSGLDSDRVAATLTSLQLKGLVRQLPGNRFVPRRAKKSASAL